MKATEPDFFITSLYIQIMERWYSWATSALLKVLDLAFIAILYAMTPNYSTCR